MQWFTSTIVQSQVLQTNPQLPEKVQIRMIVAYVLEEQSTGLT